MYFIIYYLLYYIMKNFVFISLGPNCHTAGILKKLGYKKESYPLE